MLIPTRHGTHALPPPVLLSHSLRLRDVRCFSSTSHSDEISDVGAIKTQTRLRDYCELDDLITDFEQEPNET